MLQIEILPNRAVPLSQSVTSGTDFAELLLQIEIIPLRGFECLDLQQIDRKTGSNCYRSRRFGTAAEPLRQNHHKGVPFVVV